MFPLVMLIALVSTMFCVINTTESPFVRVALSSISVATLIEAARRAMALSSKDTLDTAGPAKSTLAGAVSVCNWRKDSAFSVAVMASNNEIARSRSWKRSRAAILEVAGAATFVANARPDEYSNGDEVVVQEKIKQPITGLTNVGKKDKYHARNNR